MGEKIKIEEKTVNELWLENNHKLEKGMANLLIAPAGSGKTYWIFNTLIKEYNPSRVIYLCDTSNLKEAVAKDPVYFNKCHIVNEIYSGFNEKLTVMTYSKYGHMLLKNPKEFDGTELIICDEAHNMYNYRNKFDGEMKKNKDGILEKDTKLIYSKVIDDLFDKAKKAKTDIIFITATHRKIIEGVSYLDTATEYDENGKHIIKFNNRNTAHGRLIRTINMNKYSNIKTLKEDFTYRFCNYKNIIYHLRGYNGFKYGKKAIIYTDRIKTVLELENVCANIGLRAVGLWSINNLDNVMNDYQMIVRKSIIEKGLIPNCIDVLIINSAYETGINIKSDNIELVIVNSTDVDTQIQARSRVRKDINALLIRSSEKFQDIVITIDDKWIDRELTTKDKKELCAEYPIYNENNRIISWPSMKKVLENSGYVVSSKKITKKKITVSIINKEK